MAALLSMLRSRIKHSRGVIRIDSVPFEKPEAMHMLSIFRDARNDAAEKDDRPGYNTAKALHGALLMAILDADAWARASGAERFANAAMSVLGGRA